MPLDLDPKLIHVFKNSSPQVLQKMRPALNEKDYVELSRQAQYLKSTCTNVGALRMHKIAVKIENSCSAMDRNLTQQLIEALEGEFKSAAMELKKYEAA